MAMEAAERQGSAPMACEDCFWRRLGFPSLNRRSGGRFCEPTELGAEYAHWAFTNVVPFDKTKPSEGGTTVRYGRAAPVPVVAIPADTLLVLFAISSYELRFGCSLARWNRMDGRYNKIVLDI